MTAAASPPGARAYYEDAHVVIYHGDCRDILPQLSADFVITDPPYNAGKSYGAATDDRQTWPHWVRWFDERLSRMLIAAPHVFSFLSVTAMMQYLRMGDNPPRWVLCWHKPLALAASAIPFFHHWEPILYWGDGKRDDRAVFGDDVIRANVTPNANGHPTEKPDYLMRGMINKTPMGAIILDPFMGSGTTLRAAKDLGRKAIGIEIEEKYCSIAVERMRQSVLPLELLSEPEHGERRALL